MGYMYFIIAGLVVSFGGDVDKLEDERTAGDDAGAAREEVAANDVLEDGGFAGGLRADCDLAVVLAH